MTEIESKVVQAWHKAADDLGIRFSSPFTATTRNRKIECIGFIHHFGRRVGTIIGVSKQPSSSIGELVFKWQDEDYFISVLTEVYADYDRQLFIGTLDDWMFFGADSERPSWYSGKYWGQT
jgi:glutathione synthase/RimK-type ligase-like ATP-grasp enzyme